MKLSPKNLIRSLVNGIFYLFVFFTTATQAFAQSYGGNAQPIEYKILAPLPGIGNSGTIVSSLPEYLSAIFKLAIGGAAVLAVVMITIGGIQYMSTDAIGGKTEGKDKIKQALFGLLLAVSSWLILNTINPKLIEFNLNIGATPNINVATSTSQNNQPEQRYVYKIRTCSHINGNTVQLMAGQFPYWSNSEIEKQSAWDQCKFLAPREGPEEPPPALCFFSDIKCSLSPPQ